MNRRCLDCGLVGPWGRGGRCDAHRRARQRSRENDPGRRAYKANRYDTEYRALRRGWSQMVAAGTVDCCRCSEPIVGAFDLDHYNGTLTPAHPYCNRSARANPKKEARHNV